MSAKQLSEPSVAAAEPRLGQGFPVRVLTGDGLDLPSRLLTECNVMVAHAATTGRRVPDSVLRTVETCNTTPDVTEAAALSPAGASPCDISRLYRAHEQLQRIVEPATPRALELLETEGPDRPVMKMLGPIKFIRTLMVMALGSILVFLAMLVSLQFAPVPALEPVYVATAALVGGLFATLYRVEQRVSEGSFESKDESSYWILIVLGLIAGLVLAYLVIPEMVADEDIPQQLGKPLLALLGGFSASAVYRVLERLVETLETMVQGSGRHEAEARQRQTVAAVTAAAAEQAAEERAAIIHGLLELHRRLEPGAEASLEAQQAVDRLLAELLEKTG